MGQEGTIAKLKCIDKEIFVFEVDGSEIHVIVPASEEVLKSIQDAPMKYKHAFIEALNDEGMEVVDMEVQLL